MVRRSIEELEFFSALHSQALHLRNLRDKYEARGKIKPDRDLPNEYLRAILIFRHYLREVVTKSILWHLREAFGPSPPMRHMQVRLKPETPTSQKMVLLLKTGLDPIAGKVVALLQTLWEDGKPLSIWGMDLIMDELERLLRAEAAAKELISPHVAMVIGDLSILAECMRQIDSYQPWANRFDDLMKDNEAQISARSGNLKPAVDRLTHALRGQSVSEAGIPALGESGRFEDYPVGKRRNSKVGPDLAKTATRNLLSKPRYLQRTPEWVEPIKGIKDKSGANEIGVGGSNTVESITRPLSALFLGPDEGATSREIRGSTINTKALFAIDHRALKVFRILFFDPSPNTTPGEVAWGDFLRAMTSVGFAAQKLYGSAWHFQPTRLDIEEGIQFHEPYPQGKLPFLAAWQLGSTVGG